MRSRLSAMAVIAMASTISCGEVSGQPGLADTAQDSLDFVPFPLPDDGGASLFVARQAVWPRTTIQVCWVNPGEWDVMAWTRSQVERTWVAASGLNLVGWGACDGSPGAKIQIAVGDYWPQAYIGGWDSGTAATMWLNPFRPETYGSLTGWNTSCQSTREFCVRAMAAHEFGHALGFDHEQNRPDRPTDCPADAQGAYGNQPIGGWDRGSVMNYCNPVWTNNGELSPVDALGVWAIYGNRFPAPNRCGTMHVGESLAYGQTLSSCSGEYVVAMQGDGNLVIYGPSGALWSSGTYATGSNIAVLQGDGNFVVYDNPPRRAFWNSGSAGGGESFLAMQDDGNLVVYNGAGQALWASGTQR